MLRGDHANEELLKIDEVIAGTKDKTQASILKCLSLIVKILLSIRTNQSLIMEKQGVKKIPPKKTDETQA